MRNLVTMLCVLAATTLVVQAAETAPQANQIPNRLIDYKGFLTTAAEVANVREKHRVTEAEFVRMAAEASTVILDARSDSKYALLHIRGAKHLSFPDITANELALRISSRETRILIYCNNNFENEPKAFPSKVPSASLNIHTFNTLYNYGYKNVYELGPLVDVKKSALPFEGTLVPTGK